MDIIHLNLIILGYILRVVKSYEVEQLRIAKHGKRRDLRKLEDHSLDGLPEIISDDPKQIQIQSEK